jgi:hypothetical protein
MASGESRPQVFLDKFAKGLEAPSSGAPIELVHKWADALHGSAEIKEVLPSVVYFIADLSEIHLSGMDEVRCFFVGGPQTAPHSLVQYVETNSAPGSRLIVQTLSPQCFGALRESRLSRQALILPPSFVTELLQGSAGPTTLAASFCSQFNVSELNPYSITRSAAGSMFFGRDRELRRLLEDPDSFAIVGPMRIGKTSLVKQYLKSGKRKGNLWALNSTWIDFYECPKKTSDAIARTIAMALEPSARSDRITSNDLVAFLKYQGNRRGHPVNLILDEVDEICSLDVFDRLAEGVKNEYCRVTLCGRGLLFRRASYGLLKGRLEMIRLEPLDKHSATRLFSEPLAALGFTFDDRARFELRTLELTGRLPHMLQHYGRKLVELATEESTRTLKASHLDLLGMDLQTAEYVTSPLRDLYDPALKLMALVMLKTTRGSFTPADVQMAARTHGIDWSHEESLDACNDLVVNNILVWDAGRYRVASASLPHYAEQLGYLAMGLAEAQAAVLSKKKIAEIEMRP